MYHNVANEEKQVQYKTLLRIESEAPLIVDRRTVDVSLREGEVVIAFSEELLVLDLIHLAVYDAENAVTAGGSRCNGR